MHNFLFAVAQLKASEDTKYDVLYVNTPSNNTSAEQMGNVDLSSLVKDEALMNMWADTHTLQSTIELLKSQGSSSSPVGVPGLRRRQRPRPGTQGFGEGDVRGRQGIRGRDDARR